VWHSFSTLKNIASFQSHKEAVTAVAVAGNKQFVVSVGQDSLLKMYSISEKRQVRSVTLSSMALSSCIIMPDDKSLIIGSWDNNM
jgi:factor associated with neutral sphingomyelinase activation